MRHIHEYWTSVSYQGYSLPATAIADSIVEAASKSGGGGGGGEKCECRVTVTPNITVGGIVAGRDIYNDVPVTKVIKDLLTTTLPSSISITYTPTSAIESGVPTVYTFTTHPVNGTDPIVKQIVTFPDGTTETFNDGKSQTFTKEMTIPISEKISVKAETENKQILSGEATIKTYLPMFYGTSIDTRTEEEAEADAPGPSSLSEEEVLKLKKEVKASDYKGTYNFDVKDTYRWIWIYLPKSSKIDMSKAKSGDWPFPCEDGVEQVITINGVQQSYIGYRAANANKDENLVPVTLY